MYINVYTVLYCVLVFVCVCLYMCCVASGIDTNLRDSQGRTALEILREHPAPKSQQITALIQGKTYTHVHMHTHTYTQIAGAKKEY